jgi:hypothetical protein
VIPRTWLVDSERGRITAWVPCPTNFCSLPNALVTIRKDDWFANHVASLESSTDAAFRQLGFAGSRSRVFHESAATIKCFESVDGVADRRRGVCTALESGIFSSFEGVPSELETFYAIAKSAKVFN